MAKKKRYLQKEVETVEVYRKPTLQEAWDVVSEHMEMVRRLDNNVGTLFIDWVGCYRGSYGKPVLYKADRTVIVRASKAWQEGW
ncbi:hypothetical protein OCF63_12140 [Bacillus wiedmannii]|uniref:hypothetical protein n=1 Tax=Bacillus wiedmannii TaxID=1890302 RepID=UPI0021D3B8D2|nr:hypothetical protein [Bacillus wiedmannii]MCU5498746.1 hypothetical protein [Bacillus wiedmannii]